MLQHAAVDRPLLPRLLREAAGWNDMPSLERAADAAIVALRRERSATAPSHGLLARALVAVDDRLRTDAPEYLDDPDFPAARRVAIVQALHRFNQGVFAYRRFFAVLRPFLRGVAGQRRPARVLELASGSGEFSLALAELARRERIAVDITGSDYFPEHVAACNGKAAERGLDARFIELNAFDMAHLDAGAYDLVFIAQSIHHFSPGQVAMMVAQASRVAATAFVGIDGRRSLGLYAVVPTTGLLWRSTDFVHDSVVTLRKFYTESELELIARIAAPRASVIVRPAHPGYSVLTVLP